MVASKKKTIALNLDENASIQTKNCVAALSMMAFIAFGSLVRQVQRTLSYLIKYMEVSISVGGSHKMLWPAVICPPLM